MSDRLVGVAVTGQGRVGASPDIVVAEVAATAERPRSAEAAEAASVAMREMVAAARDAGVADADRRTTSIGLRSWRPKQGAGLRYVAAQRLRLRLRDVATAGDIVAKVMAAGGDYARMHDFGLRIEDPTAYHDQAREAAMRDARQRAERIAALAGRELGVVVSVREFSPSAPVAFAARTMAAPEGGGGTAPVVEAGEQDVEIQLEVEFDWAD